MFTPISTVGGKKNANDKTDSHLCPGSSVPSGTQDCEQSKVIAVCVLFPEGQMSVLVQTLCISMGKDALNTQIRGVVPNIYTLYALIG